MLFCSVQLSSIVSSYTSFIFWDCDCDCNKVLDGNYIVWTMQCWTDIALVLGIIHRVLYVAVLQFGYHLGEEEKKAIQASEE